LAAALRVPRWSLAFDRRHAAWVVGISLIPAAQRAVSRLLGDRLPGWTGSTLEGLTAARRVLLVVLIVGIAILADERLQSVSTDASLARVRSFVRRLWPSPAIQGALILGLGGRLRHHP
jgi:hypothetical protein